MLRKTSVFILFLVIQFTVGEALATFIPPDQIKAQILRFGPEDANMTEEEFDQMIEQAQEIYEPIVKGHGGRLNIRGDWDDDTLNASASQFFGTWYVNMYGGLARHPELTKDGFAMIICHELGHHLAGFSFRKGGGLFGGTWAANEGQSDYFASHVCARKLWGEQKEINAGFRGTIHKIAEESCDERWATQEERDLCYRINAGGESLAATLAALSDTDMPDYETPDENVVNKTNDKHPAAQCRLDTYFAGSLCPAAFDDNLIPGKKVPQGVDSIEAEKEAANHSCTEYSGYDYAHRPLCWFKPRL